MTDRDHFAAAALTGLLYQEVDDEFAMPYIVGRAYLWADAMLRERCREGGDCPGQDNAANLDAAPAARASEATASPERVRVRGDAGTGDTPDSPQPIACSVFDRSQPINGPDPDSRVWETPVHTPAPHATQGECSKPREGKEPVAWAVRYRHGDTGIVDLCRTLADCRAKWSNRTTDYWLYEPLYRHPPCQDVSQKNLTLTDRERGAIERAVDSIASTMPYESQQGAADWKTLRGLLERLGGVE